MPGSETTEVNLSDEYFRLYKNILNARDVMGINAFLCFAIKHPDTTIAHAVGFGNGAARDSFFLAGIIEGSLQASLANETSAENQSFQTSLTRFFCDILESASFKTYRHKVAWQYSIGSMLVVATEQDNCCIDVIKMLANTLPMLDPSYRAAPYDWEVNAPLPCSVLLRNLSGSIKGAIQHGHVEAAKLLLNVFKKGYELSYEVLKFDKVPKKTLESFVESATVAGNAELVELFLETYVAELDKSQGDIECLLMFCLRAVREKFLQLDRYAPDPEIRNAYRSNYASVMLFLCRYSVESKLLQQETDQWETRKRESEQLKKGLGDAAPFWFSRSVVPLPPLKGALQETLVFSAKEGLLPIIKLLLPHLDNADQVLQAAAEHEHPSIVYECLSIAPERRAELQISGVCYRMLTEKNMSSQQFLRAIFGDRFAIKNIGVLRIKLLPLDEQSQVPVMEEDGFLHSFVADFLVMYRALRDSQSDWVKTDKWSKVDVATIADEQLGEYAGWIVSHGLREPDSRTGKSLRLLSLFYTAEKDLVDLFGEIHRVANPSRVCISSAMHRPQLTQQSASVAASAPIFS